MAKQRHFKLLVKKKLDEDKFIWEEADEVNLGSIKNPNKHILEFCFEPIDSNPRQDMFRFGVRL